MALPGAGHQPRIRGVAAQPTEEHFETLSQARSIFGGKRGSCRSLLGTDGSPTEVVEGG